MESCDLSAKKLRILASLIKKAKRERVSFSLNTSSFPEPIYHQSSPSNTLNLKELQEKLLTQTALIDKLSKALRYCLKELGKPRGSETLEELKGLFRRRQNKVAHVLKKTLAELKASKEHIAVLEEQIKNSDRDELIANQHRLASGLQKALHCLRARSAQSYDIVAERKKIEQQISARYKLLLDEAEKKQLVLEGRIKKDEETHNRLKKGFEEVLASVKREFADQLAAKEAEMRSQEDKQAAQGQETQEYKKQVALLKAHLEGILNDKKKLEQTLKTMRQCETAPLENKLKENEVLLQTKEDELTYMQKHLGRKIQEIAGLQEMLQEQENLTKAAQNKLEETIASIEELKNEHNRDQGLLNEEIAALKEMVDQKVATIDSLQQDIVRLTAVEEDYERMANSISLLQQNLLRVK